MFSRDLQGLGCAGCGDVAQPAGRQAVNGGVSEACFGTLEPLRGHWAKPKGRASDLLHTLPTLLHQLGFTLSCLQAQIGKLWYWRGGRIPRFTWIETRISGRLSSSWDQWKMLTSKRLGQNHNGVCIWVSFSVGGCWVHLWDDATNWCTVPAWLSVESVS